MTKKIEGYIVTMILMSKDLADEFSGDKIILFYDFIYNNPKNIHVRGIKKKEINSLRRNKIMGKYILETNKLTKIFRKQ